MRVFIEVDLDNDAFRQDLYDELHSVLSTVPGKVLALQELQVRRFKGRAKEGALLDRNGNTVGSIRLEKT